MTAGFSVLFLRGFVADFGGFILGKTGYLLEHVTVAAVSPVIAAGLKAVDKRQQQWAEVPRRRLQSALFDRQWRAQRQE